MDSFVAIDLEYSDASRLPLRLGLVEVRERVVVARHGFWFRVVGRPWHFTGTGHHYDNMFLRGEQLTEDVYAGSPYIVDAWPAIDAIIAGRLVVAHGAGLDFARVRAGFDAHGAPWPALQYTCSLSIAKKVWKPWHRSGANHTLDELSTHVFPEKGLLETRYNVCHDAVEDAEACAEVILAAMRETGTATLDELIAHTGTRTWRMEANQCQTSKGWVERGYSRARPVANVPYGLNRHPGLQVAAYLEIRAQWRGDPGILDERRVPRPEDPWPDGCPDCRVCRCWRLSPPLGRPE
ncbi:hypothetical protein [Promicromonospora aerolata]|uniref:Exonuclease domain-containing protein n=1 Tax=Promicromonospora aerolata TaxID=195749 RepID=A0ABW4V2J1_9MICO